ncbi:MAG: ATP-binding cassette domain-containing protein [Candidatus Malihini olakiniferum]
MLLLGCSMVEARMPLMMLNHMVAKAKISITRIQEVLNIPILTPALEDLKPADASVTFEAVSFHYETHNSVLVLENVSLNASAGSITVLVRRSGAGKSTVTTLSHIFGDISAGHILISGVDIRMSKFGYADASGSLCFSGKHTLTIANNIRLGLTDTPLDAVMSAANMA